jgi:hypothetical protein
MKEDEGRVGIAHKEGEKYMQKFFVKNSKVGDISMGGEYNMKVNLREIRCEGGGQNLTQDRVQCQAIVHSNEH